MSRQHRIFAIRGGLILCYLLLALAMFLTGRTHTLLLDNKGSQEGMYTAVKGMTVRVNGGDSEEMLRNDRILLTVKGQRTRLEVEFFDGSPSQEFTLKIPLFQDTVLLSVPKLLAGVEPALEAFSTD
ncbi:MAG: hypothetical protein IKB33_00255 [Spirochaetaceae bacterium]|nr:hypothetical protein [Spirochaetaceae bacterium]